MFIAPIQGVIKSIEEKNKDFFNNPFRTSAM